jgi:hypothetical protein
VNTAFIKDLASACSTQAQVANRTWIALMTVSVIAVLPRSSSSGADFQVPLGLGTVDPAWFNVVMLALLTVLAIAFSAAYAQQFRAKRLAQMQLNKLPTVDEGNVHIHPRDFFDALLIPSVNRVAPIAQLYLISTVRPFVQASFGEAEQWSITFFLSWRHGSSILRFQWLRCGRAL